MNLPDLDPRLVEHVAACLCWAEWASTKDRSDDPWSYWQTVHESAKAKYYRDARHIAAALVSHGGFAVLPTDATDAMCEAALDAGRGVRTSAGARSLWKEMRERAHVEMKWRSGDLDNAT